MIQIGLLVTALMVGGGFNTSTGSNADPGGEEVQHDFHVTYGSLAVEGSLAVLRIRFFADDLELALRTFSGDGDFQLKNNSVTDSVFGSYLNKSFSMIAGGETLSATLVDSGEDQLDREPVWWYVIQYESDVSIADLTVRNEIMFELFEDQKNIFKVAHFPDDERRAYYFASGEGEMSVSFW